MSLKTLLKSVTKKEWLFIAVVSAVLIVLTSVSLIYGSLTKPNGYQLTGLRAFVGADINIYYSYINQISDGALTLRNQYTTEAQGIQTFNIFWLFTGKMAALLNISAKIAFQLIRVLLIPLIVTSSYLFISYFLDNKIKRKITLGLLLFSSGIGAYFNGINYSNSAGDIYARVIDLWMPESSFFNTIMYEPHFILASSLIITIFLLFLMAIENNKQKYSIAAGLLTLLLFNFHPYHLPTIYLIPLIYLVYLWVNKKIKVPVAIKHYSWLIVLSAPSILYHLYTMQDLLISARAAQNVTLSGPFYFFILGLGLPLIFGFVGMYLFFKHEKESKPKFMFLAIWILASLVLIYLPTWQFQRRLIQGAQLPMIIFAVEAYYYLKSKIKVKDFLLAPLVYIFLGIFLLAPTTLFNLSRDARLYYDKHSFYYLSESALESLQWLNKQSGENIIAGMTMGNFIPAYTDKTVFWGHAHETLNSEAKYDLLHYIFSGEAADMTVQNSLETYNLDYVFWSPIEKEVFADFDPSSKKYLEAVFNNDEVTIYKVL